MAISFPTLPVSLQRGVFTEFDESQSNQGPSIQPYQVLMVGEKIAAGTATANAIDLISSADDAKGLYGAGSSMHVMAKKYFQTNNSINKLYGASTLPAGTAGTHTIQVTGTATGAGTIALYIHGERIQISVAVGDINTAIASAIDAAIDAYTAAGGHLMAAPSVATDTVTLTGLHASVLSNKKNITVQHSLDETEKLPAGVTLAIVQDVVSGSGIPTLTTIIANMGETQYNLVLWPYGSDGGAAETAMVAEMLDRWGPIRQNEGVMIGAEKDTHGNLITFGDSKNSQFLHFVGGEATMPTASMELAASLCGVAARQLQADPARPLQTLVLLGVQPAPLEDRFTLTERGLQNQDGMATQFTDAGGLVRVDRTVSTWQTNSAGSPSAAFKDLMTFATLSFMRFDLNSTWSSKFPRHKLASDASAKRFGAGQAVMTPTLAKAELVAKFLQWEELALVEDLGQFKNDLVVEISPTDPNRLQCSIGPNLVNQLRVSAFLIQFRL